MDLISPLTSQVVVGAECFEILGITATKPHLGCHLDRCSNVNFTPQIGYRRGSSNIHRYAVRRYRETHLGE